MCVQSVAESFSVHSIQQQSKAQITSAFFRVPSRVHLKILKLFDILVGGRRLDGDFLVCVKIGGVARAAALGSEGRLGAPVQNLLPVDRPEPAVPFDVGGAVFQVAKSPRQINLQHGICELDHLGKKQ